MILVDLTSCISAYVFSLVFHLMCESVLEVISFRIWKMFYYFLSSSISNKSLFNSRKLLGSWKEDSDVPYCGYFSIYCVEHLMTPFNLETQVY